jgi:perosamine synthetase
MSNLQAAIGLGQIERIDELIAGKRRIFSHYERAFVGLPLTMNPEPHDAVNGYWMPTLVFDKKTGVTRKALQTAFAAHNIDARVFFHPLSSLPMFQAQMENAHAYDIPGRAINLPTYHDMIETDLDRVVAVIRSLPALKGLACEA